LERPSITSDSQKTRLRYRILQWSYGASHITGEYHLDKGDWGAVLGYFGYGYMFGALSGGMLADRFGPRCIWIRLECAAARAIPSFICVRG
jgi:MFS transporter, ACS family, hexuronate transporter